MGLTRAAGLFGLWGLAVTLAACGSGGGVSAGGSCYLATDCAEGLYCQGVKSSPGGVTAGKCTSNANLAEPADAMGYADGGELPDDGLGTDAKPIGDAPADMGPADEGTPPKDSGGGS